MRRTGLTDSARIEQLLFLYEHSNDKRVGGYFFRYENNEEMRLEYVSKGFCLTLGYLREEVERTIDSEYTRLVHPQDVQRYREFVREIVNTGEPGSIDYRLLRKDGSTIHVQDDVRALVDDDGATIIVAMFHDVTELRNQIDEFEARLQVYEEVYDGAPFGIVRAEIGDSLRLVYANDTMMKMLGIGGSRHNTRDSYMGENLSFFLHESHLDNLDAFVERLRTTGENTPYRARLLARNRNLINVSGWARCFKYEDGREVIHFSCVERTQQVARETQTRIQVCVDAMGSSFDYILLLDTAHSIARGVSGNLFQWSESVGFMSLSMHDLLVSWIENEVAPEDRELVTAYLSPVLSGEPRLVVRSAPGERLTFTTMPKDDGPHRAQVFLPDLGEGVFLFCYRDVTNVEEGRKLRTANKMLGYELSRYKELLSLSSKGFMAFSLGSDDVVHISGAAGEACRIFNIPEVSPTSPGRLERTLDEFIAKSQVTIQEFEELLAAGTKSIAPMDGPIVRPGALLDCYSSRESDTHYLIVRGDRLGSVGVLRDAEGSPDTPPMVFIRTFGYFEVFVGGKPIAFNHAKSKELLALLVDRRGGYISSHEAISFLWEDEPANNVTLARYRKVAMRLKNILEEYGVAHILDVSQRSRRIETRAVRCDLYDYLWGGPQYGDLFQGSYLLDYSWSEQTLSELLNKSTRALA